MESYPFAAANIKAQENKLISFDKALKILDADNPDSALRALLETGYGGVDISSPSMFEDLISEEIKRTVSHIKQIMPNISDLNIFLLQKDYHNLKVLLKSAYKGDNLSKVPLIKNGTLDEKVLMDAVLEKKYSNLTPFMSEALIKLDREFSVREDVSLIGLYLDNAYGLELYSRLSDVKSMFIKEYLRIYADFTNLISLFRIGNMDLPRSALNKILLPFGIIPLKTFMDAYEAPADALTSIFARGIYDKRFSVAIEETKKQNSLFPLEKSRDDYLMETVKKYNNDFMSPAIALGYLFAKEREAENIRVIMSAKINNLDNETTLSLLKEMYS